MGKQAGAGILFVISPEYNPTPYRAGYRMPQPSTGAALGERETT